MTLARMLRLLPLFLAIGVGATLSFGSGFPFHWKIGGCPPPGVLIPCVPITYNWFNFGVDVLSYTLLGYWLIVVIVGVRQRVSGPASTFQALQREVLRNPFKLALFGGALMLVIPLLTFPSMKSAGVACLDPSPCLTQENRMVAGWGLTTTLWAYASILTMFVAPLGVAEEKWHRLLGSLLLGLSAVHLSGLEVFFTSGAYALFDLSQVLVPAIGTAFGPLLVVSGGFLAINSVSTRVEKTGKFRDGLKTPPQEKDPQVLEPEREAPEQGKMKNGRSCSTVQMSSADGESGRAHQSNPKLQEAQEFPGPRSDVYSKSFRRFLQMDVAVVNHGKCFNRFTSKRSAGCQLIGRQKGSTASY